MGQRNQENFCIHCGKPISSGDAFCVNCGAKITPQEEGAVTASSRDMICPVCGAEISSDDLFCTNCGSRLSDYSQHPVAPGRPKLKKPLLIVCVGILLVTAVIGGYLWWNRGEGAVSAGNSDAHAKNAITSQEAGKNELPLSDPSGETEQIPTVAPDEGETVNQTPAVITDNDSEEEILPDDITTGGAIDLEQLHLGIWVPAGQTVGDEVNGWQALYLNAFDHSSVTFSLEKSQGGTAGRMVTTYPVTVTLENGKGTFAVSDSWGNTGNGEIEVTASCIHVDVTITSFDPSSLYDISMNTDFYPDVISSTDSSVSNKDLGITSQPPVESVTLSDDLLGTTEEAIYQEFVYQSFRHGASFYVDNTMFVGGDETAMFQFDFGEATANFSYSYDRSFGELSVGAVSNRSKLTELANAAFLILSGDDDSESFKGLISQVWDSEPAHETYYIEERAEETGSLYVETVLDSYICTYTADDYTCTFSMYHNYDSLEYGISAETYSCNIKFSQS